MVKEYIERLMLEEQDEIEKLQIQMKKALNELESSQEWLENLQREKRVDLNIFSPRKFDSEADEKIEKARAAVRECDQNVEYIKNQIESCTKRNHEYLKLQEENELEKQRNIEGEMYAEAECRVEQIQGKSDTHVEQIYDETENQAAQIPIKSDMHIGQIHAETENQTKPVHGKSEDGKSDEILVRNTTSLTKLLTKADLKNGTESQNAKEVAEHPEKITQPETIHQEYIEKAEVVGFLKSIYKKTEVSLALISGDKNKCKNQMRNIMHEIKSYVLELEKNEKM